MTYLYYSSNWYNSHWHSNTHHSPMCCGHSKLAIILTTPTEQSGLPVPLVAVSHRVALKVILVSVGVSRVIVSVQPRWFATLDPAVVADDRALHLLSLGQRAGCHGEGEGHPENGVYTQAHGGGCWKIWWVEYLGWRNRSGEFNDFIFYIQFQWLEYWVVKLEGLPPPSCRGTPLAASIGYK